MTDEVKKRPEYRNINAIFDLPKYRLPLAGWVSILHRISGLLIFLLLPFVLYLFDLSLTKETTFNSLAAFTSGWFVKLIILALVWGYLHHFCAGIRHLFMDFHIGVDKDAGCKSAIGVFAVSLPLAALVGLKLFGVF
jgi:succinate dehydrogenase / fumarate reductase cytochrome b subunit